MRVVGGICRDFARSSKLEWLETNGTGAFAMGTVAGVNTRRYHALLVASLRPPGERSVLLSRVEEEVVAGGQTFALGACQYPGVVNPRGFEWIDEFHTDPCATWHYTPGDFSIEKQVYLIDGRQAVMIRYRSDRGVTLRVRPFLAYRDYHSLTHAQPDPYHGLPRLHFQHSGQFEGDAHWYNNIEYLAELDRGLDFREDLYTPGVITLELTPGQWTPVCASLDEKGPAEPTPRADPFVVRRADGKPTIIAGYPWFTDWGRDTMISLPGLLISSGRLEEARAVLEMSLEHMSQGVIPNRFTEAGETPQYNTADATLWMFQVVDLWLNAGGDQAFLSKIFYPAAKEIIEWHQRGTWYGIGVDHEDHLLRAGTPGTQLTWMDAKVGDWVVTPRHGKPVEINALWHGALSLMAKWSSALSDPKATEFQAEAKSVRDSFRARFWNAGRNCLYDVLTDQGPVKHLRPNQIFAVSLPYGLLERDQQQAVVRIVQQELLTPVGLRTLEPGDPDYKPRYEGSPLERDGAYHQGTVWPWLLGPFIDAYMAAFGATETTLEYCRGLIERLDAESSKNGCLGSIAEVYDGDEPRRPGGCPAQAWSVAEIERVRATYGWSRGHLGWIEVICGPMFAGKSEELIRRLRQARIARKRVQVFKPALDDRYSTDEIVTHGDHRMKAEVVATTGEMREKLDWRAQVIGIDESNFFGHDLVELAQQLADSGKQVIIAGLDTDYLGRPFPPMPELLCLAESITKTLAICMRCGNPAEHTQRLLESSDLIMVGGTGAYEARCTRCFEPGVPKQEVLDFTPPSFRKDET